MTACADIEGRGIEIFTRSVADHYIPPAFLGTRFKPVDVTAIESNLGKPNRLGDDQVRSNRRFPGAVRCEFHAYQTLHICAGAMGWPSLQLNAFRNSGIFETTPFTRNWLGECG